MMQADGYFIAPQLRLHDKDVVLMATAQPGQFVKVMTIVRATTGTYCDLTRSIIDSCGVLA